MKLTFEDLDDFYEFLPMVIGTAINDTDPDSPSAEFYDNMLKKMKTSINKYVREVPEQRLKLKRFIRAIDGNQNVVFTIKNNEQPKVEKVNEHGKITQYLTEKYVDSNTRMEKYL